MANSLVGQQLGNYRLLHLLETSDLADVYSAKHSRSKTHAMIKVLQTRLTQQTQEQFFITAHNLSRLQHPNIVGILDFGVKDGIPFLATDITHGKTMRQLYPKGTRVPEERIVRVVLDVTAALQYAHDQHIVHGGVRPEHILLADNDFVLLTDIGVTLITSASSPQQTTVRSSDPASITYTAPEQLQGQAVPASDQYSLAMMVYEWLCGDVAFHGTIAEINEQQLIAPPHPLSERCPDISPFLEEVIMVGLRKKPEQRFANIRAFATALKQARSLPIVLRSDLAPKPIPLASPPDIALLDTNVPRAFRLPNLLSRRALMIAGASLVTVGLGATGLAIAQQLSTITPNYVAIAGNVFPTVPPQSPAVLSKSSLGNTLSIFRGHSGQVFVVGWSPDGQRVASGAEDTTVRVWNAASGGDVLVYQGHDHNVYAVTWSLDGKYIASGGVDKTAQIWDAATGKTLLTYTGHAKQVNTTDWSPDNTRVVTSSNDHSVQIWDASSGKQLYSYTHTKSPRGVVWSPDGKYIASAGDDYVAQVYRADDWKQMATYSDHTARVWSMSWSPDSRYVASCGDDLTVRIWDALKGTTVRVYTGHSTSVYTVSWASSGKYIASGSLNIVQVWDAVTGNILYTYGGHSLQVSAAKWSPNATDVASCSKDETVQIWQGV